MKQNRRKQIEDWFEAEIAESESVNLPAMTKKAAFAFADNRPFVMGLLVETLTPVIYDIGKRFLQKTRGGRVIEMGDEIVTEGEFKTRSAPMRSRFARWMEHAGDRHVNFMKMYREDLETAAQEREKRAYTEFKVARFERIVAGELKDHQKVEDRFTPEELERMWERIDEEEAA